MEERKETEAETMSEWPWSQGGGERKRRSAGRREPRGRTVSDPGQWPAVL